MKGKRVPVPDYVKQLWAARERRERQENQAQSRQTAESSRDFDRSGLGIGGAGRHDLAAETRELIARREMHYVERAKRGPMPNGQLWQPCSVRGCNNEPVCVDCMRCRKHCRC